MRFYVFSVQHNMVAGSENRGVPKAYNTLDEAVAEFHREMAADMKNDTLDWALVMVINSEGGIHRNEKWTRPAPEPLPEETEDTVTE